MVTAVVSQECELWSGKRLCEGNWWLMVWPYHSLQFNHSSVVSLSLCISCRTQPSAGRAEATRSPEWRGRRGGGVGRRESNDTEDEICDMTKEYANKWKETVKLWYTIWINTRYSFFFFVLSSGEHLTFSLTSGRAFSGRDGPGISGPEAEIALARSRRTTTSLLIEVPLGNVIIITPYIMFLVFLTLFFVRDGVIASD